MSNKNMIRRVQALALTAMLMAAMLLPCMAAYEMPIETAAAEEAVYMFDADTGKPILQQNADEQRYIASLTKLMAALLVVESDKEGNAVVTVPAELTQELKDIRNANGTTIGLRIGETLTEKDLLYAMVLGSANDATSTLAYSTAGSLAAFVKEMNARAEELGCTATSFSCAHGLYDYGNAATARDLGKIAAACNENEEFVRVVKTDTYTLQTTNYHAEQRTIGVLNPLMDTESGYYRDYIQWAKGGFTTLAGRCIVAFAQKDGHTYGLVILGCDSQEHLYAECDALFDWAFESFCDRELVDTETELTAVALNKCRTSDVAELYAADAVSGYGHEDDKVTYSFDVPDSISATVDNGQVVGTATVYLDGYEVGVVNLVTHREYVSEFRTDCKATLLLLVGLVFCLSVLTAATIALGGGSLKTSRYRNRRKRR